jgi:ketosteroid isomerase-like protein
MSRENVEVVKRGYAACNRRDLEAALALTHPEADLRATGRLPDTER